MDYRGNHCLFCIIFTSFLPLAPFYLLLVCTAIVIHHMLSKKVTQPLRELGRMMNTEAFPAILTTMLPKETFLGRTAFITGGGTGLGKAISKMLAILGANVFISSRRSEVLKSACEEISKETGKLNVAFASADVRDSDSVASALKACHSVFGTPDLIVNNAAGNFISPTKNLSSRAFGKIVDIVLKGTANVTLESAKLLIDSHRRGSYLSISTIYAQTGSGYVVPSAAAKAGIETMVKSLAAEWGRYGLRFNAIAPGPIYTEGAFSRLDPTGVLTEGMINRIPAGRIGRPEELANLATYLLSDYASWINGEIVRLDGGELPFISGEFNALSSLVKDEQWEAIEAMIRRNSK